MFLDELGKVSGKLLRDGELEGSAQAGRIVNKVAKLQPEHHSLIDQLMGTKGTDILAKAFEHKKNGKYAIVRNHFKQKQLKSLVNTLQGARSSEIKAIGNQLSKLIAQAEVPTIVKETTKNGNSNSNSGGLA